MSKLTMLSRQRGAQSWIQKQKLERAIRAIFDIHPGLAGVPAPEAARRVVADSRFRKPIQPSGQHTVLNTITWKPPFFVFLHSVYLFKGNHYRLTSPSLVSFRLKRVGLSIPRDPIQKLIWALGITEVVFPFTS